MIKIKKKFKKLLALIMTILTLSTFLPLSVFAKYITDMNSDAEFGVIAGSRNEYGHEMHYATYDGTDYMVFCCQFGRTSPTGKKYEFDEDFYIEYMNDKKSYEKIAEYIYFGYTMKYGVGLPKTKNAKKAACATQQYVWEYIYKNINEEYGYPKRNSWDSTYMSSDIYKEWLEETEEYYDMYHSAGVSFDGKTKKIELGESKTFTDTNKVLKDYPTFSKKIDGVKFEHKEGSNDLVVTVEESSEATKVKFKTSKYDIFRLLPNGDEFDNEKMSNYMYFNFSGTKIQNLMFSDYVDPENFSITIGVESGDLELFKTDNNDTPLQGCTFKIYEDAECTERIATATTDVNGKILFDSISPGDIYIKETKVPSRIFDRYYYKKSNCKKWRNSRGQF